MAVWLEAAVGGKAGGEISPARLVVVKEIEVEDGWEAMVATLSERIQDGRMSMVGL